MESLKPPDHFHLLAAIGWLELGNWREAKEELENITPDLRARPDVLEVRYEICAKAEQWDLAAETAHALCRILPLAPQYWIWRAYATRRMTGGGIAAAREILIKARSLFPTDSVIAYNLACYACQLGDKEEAWKWLKTAFGLGDPKGVKLMALADKDLEPLWKEIGEV
jgi:tetratricopeptide (TPR) repeat protein